MSNSLQQTRELDQLFTTCLQRNFPSQDISQVRRSCTRLANLCSYSGTTFIASKHWLSEFKDKQKKLDKKSNADKDAKKKAKKDKKKEKKQKKEAKKKQHKQEKDKLKHMSKKEKKEFKKQQKQQKEQDKKQRKQEKKQKKERKAAEKKNKKEQDKNMSDDEKKALKAQKKQAKKDKKKQKQEKKKAAKKDKKAKKFQKKAGKVGKKLLKEEDKLEAKQQKISKKLATIMDKAHSEDSKDYSNKPEAVEQRLATIRAALKGRDRSISRYATCLAFISEDRNKDSVDAQCVALKKASEFAFKAEQCWARYLDVMSQCKAQSNKKRCYKSLGSLDSVCGDLEAQSKSHLSKVFNKEAAELK